MESEDKEKPDENNNNVTPPQYMPSVEPITQPEHADQNLQQESPQSLGIEDKTGVNTGKTPDISRDNVAKTGISIQFVILIAVIAATVAFLAGWFGYQEFIAKPSNAKSNEPVSSKSTSTTPTPIPTSTSSSEMTMLKINQVAKYTWESDPNVYGTSRNIPNITYTLGSATRVPSITDTGGSIGQYKDKEWVAIEIKATDNRTSGQSRQLYYVDNMRLVDKGNKVPPVEDFIYIKPLETKTFYVIFPIEKSSNSFELMMGDLAKPSLFKIDFANGVKQTGYFSMRGGYSETQ